MYKLNKNPMTGKVDVVIYQTDNLVLSFPMNPDNSDYQAYLKWVAEGNTPLPAESN